MTLEYNHRAVFQCLKVETENNSDVAAYIQDHSDDPHYVGQLLEGEWHDLKKYWKERIPKWLHDLKSESLDWTAIGEAMIDTHYPTDKNRKAGS